MATNETEFTRKMKSLFRNRAVIVTAVTLLAATGIIIAVTVSANRAKKPMPEGTTTTAAVVEPANTEATPSGKEASSPSPTMSRRSRRWRCR